jgi:Mlc titration factor MtfA (ptsG expression regulator)
MFFTWFRERRRRRILAEAFPEVWRGVLRERVRHYQYLNDAQRARLEGCVQVLVAEKDWASGSGFAITDEVKVTIAGFAGVMTLGLTEPYYFDRLDTIIVYAGGYVARRSEFDTTQSWFEPSSERLGEAWHRGPVILSWAEIGGRKGRRPGDNLVFHEFAHHVDGLAGEIDGVPPMTNFKQERMWYRVTEEEFHRLADDARHRRATLLDQYGATDRAEFFAVATECFFERPRAMRELHPALYQVLSEFYCQNTAEWLPDAVAPQHLP